MQFVHNKSNIIEIYSNQKNDYKNEVLMKKIIPILLFIFTAAFAQSALAHEHGQLKGKVVEYTVGGEEYEGYFISPSKDAPLILMIHDWDGLTDYEIKRAHMLAKQGYAVFAADMFGKGVRPTEVKDKKAQTGALYKNRPKMRDLFNSALEVAKENGADISNAVAMGYCFGGTTVLEMARTGLDLKGFVSFHGGLKTPEGQDYTKSKGNILVFHGSADTAVSLDDFINLTKELETAGVSNEMITYSDAPHAFTVFGSERYQQAADERSWERFGDYLKKSL